MKELHKKDDRKPGLEEALHPEIGNDAFWVNDDHAFSLRTADPLKSLDQDMLDDDIKLKAIREWENNFSGNTPPPDDSRQEQKEIESHVETEQETPKFNITKESAEKIVQPEKEDDTELPEPEELDSAIKKEKKKKDKAAHKAGKRIRKVAEKMSKEEEERTAEKPKTAIVTPEPNLSPFTYWLKGLTGSEYVHPYEDDFAFNQGSSHAGEGISETFADLLAAQGYKDQAIAMYTKLAEKFPEKSRFFAAKIEALQ